MAAEQGFYGLVAALRAFKGENSLYRMADAISIGESTGLIKGEGLPGKNADVKAVGITAPGMTFPDIVFSDNITAIESLASRGIVTGRTADTFDPAGTITRQEAAVMVARAAKLCGMDTGLSTAAVRDMLAQFGDYVTVESWAQSSLAFCYQEGILDQSDLNIEPTKEILRGEIAQMLFNMLTKANL